LISSTIIEHLRSYCDPEPSLAVAYFYFDFISKQTVAECVSSLIKQLFVQEEVLPDSLKELYNKYGGNHKASIFDLTNLLETFATSRKGNLSDIFFVIDALDECLKDGQQDLLKLIEEMKSWESSKIHLLLTSRPEQDIRDVVSPLTTKAISIQGCHVDSDISLYVVSQLAADPKLKKWSPQMKAEIEGTLAKKANGMQVNLIV